MAALPTELLIPILLWACGSRFKPTIDNKFLLTRQYIRGTCIRWQAVVDDNCCFWTQCSFYSWDNSDFFLWSLSNLPKQGLEMRILFGEDLSWYRLSRPGPNVDPEDGLELLAPHIPACRTLVIEGNNRSYPFICTMLTDHPALDLDSLTIGRVNVMDTVTYPRCPDIIRSIFAGKTPKLRTLRLDRAIIEWNQPSTFATITTLIINNIATPYAPSSPQMMAALRACVRLERLSVRGTHFPLDVDEAPVVDFVIPPLVELDLQINGYLEVAEFFALCNLPNLRRISFHVSSISDIFCAVRCRSLFVSAVDIVISSDQSFAEFLFRFPWERVHLLSIFQMFLRVEKLDLCNAGPHFFPSMLDGAGSVCPLLREIIVSQPMLSHVKQFLSDRPPPRTLSSLSMYDINYLDGDELYMGGIEKLISRSGIFIDVPREDGMRWVDEV